MEGFRGIATGDARFSGPYRRVSESEDPAAVIRELPDEDVVAALAAAVDAQDPYIANVLATEAQNRVRRAATALRHLGEGVAVLTAEGRVRHLNPAAERMLGRTSRALRGRSFHEAVHRRRGGEPVAADACPILDATRRGVTTGDNHDVFERRDGSRFLAGYTASPVMRGGEAEGVVLVFRDITARKAREDQLRLAQHTMDEAPVPIFWITASGGVRYANNAAARHLGYPREELERMRVPDFNPTMEASDWAAHWEGIKARGSHTFTSVHRTREGRRVPVELTANHVQLGADEFHATFVRRLSSLE